MKNQGFVFELEVLQKHLGETLGLYEKSLSMQCWRFSK